VDAEFYGYDGGGTARLLTDSTGTVTDTYDYDAWGNVVNTTGTTPNAYLYRGEQYDPDLGLYLPARPLPEPVERQVFRRGSRARRSEGPGYHSTGIYTLDPTRLVTMIQLADS